MDEVKYITQLSTVIKIISNPDKKFESSDSFEAVDSLFSSVTRSTSLSFVVQAIMEDNSEFKYSNLRSKFVTIAEQPKVVNFVKTTSKPNVVQKPPKLAPKPHKKEENSSFYNNLSDVISQQPKTPPKPKRVIGDSFSINGDIYAPRQISNIYDDPYDSSESVDNDDGNLILTKENKL